MTKATKEKANYRQGTPEAHCGICSMFRPPRDMTNMIGKCTAVAGEISPAMLCDYYEPRRDATLATMGMK